MINRFTLLAASAAVLALSPAPAAAQFQNEGAVFVDAVRKQDNNKALELLKSRPSVVNARDAKGETALIAALSGRDLDWAGHLLNNGADASLAARNGDTPLIAAARSGLAEAIQWLLKRGAKVDAANRMGETALILAVQQRHVPVVKLLLDSGANPDETDSAAGYSARDYAKRDVRGREILRLIEAKKPQPASAQAGR